jgi:hypothetical protein
MILRSRVDKLLKEAVAVEAATAEDSRRNLYATEEEKRRMFVETWAADCPRVFGADDRRADRAYLETLMLHELCMVFREMIDRNIAAWKATNPPELVAFRQLDAAAKIQVLTKHLHFDATLGVWR